MPGMFDMIKKAPAMMKQMKQLRQIQKELARKTIVHSSSDGKVKVHVSGDMCVKKIEIDPALLQSISAVKLGDVIARTVNEALDKMKAELGSNLADTLGGMDPSELLRGLGMK
jgi:DNA-binding YbaB/EbfC family protein